MRMLLTVLGALMILSGLLWSAQGAGLFPYPAQSFMVGSRPWVGYGLGFAALGLVVLLLGRRR